MQVDAATLSSWLAALTDEQNAPILLSAFADIAALVRA